MSEVQGRSSIEAARTGVTSPLLLDATLSSDRALVIGSGSYDTARSAALFDSAAEVRVRGPFALRADVTYRDDTRRMRPTPAHACSSSGRPHMASMARSVASSKRRALTRRRARSRRRSRLAADSNHLYLLGNITYGQDPEGDERDGGLRAAALAATGPAVIGLEARGRSAIGAQHGTNSAVEPRLDFVGGAVGMMTVNSFVLFAEVGPSAFKLQATNLRWGVASLAGVCAVF